MEWIWIFLPIAAIFAMVVFNAEALATALLAATPVAAFLLPFFLEKRDRKDDLNF